jgi:hypothetical protein
LSTSLSVLHAVRKVPGQKGWKCHVSSTWRDAQANNCTTTVVYSNRRLNTCTHYM